MEELYRSLYAKYAAGLDEDEMNGKVQYALQQDPSEFINAFYKKYTGAGPSESQVNYINSYLSNPQPSTKETASHSFAKSHISFTGKIVPKTFET